MPKSEPQPRERLPEPIHIKELALKNHMAQKHGCRSAARSAEMRGKLVFSSINNRTRRLEYFWIDEK
jgi:hypothetical protein